MIYVMTVHWRSPQWIAPQLDYLHRHVRAPHKVFAVINGIEDRSLWEGFDHAVDLPGHHGTKLNALAALVAEEADPDDVLVFLDSDAFPIRALDPWLEPALAAHRLVAIQRRENFGDLRPHPSFCATTLRTWSEIGGDWTREEWTTPTGAVLEDAGTRVLAALEEHEIDWLPLVRTNTTDVHPLWFGVYGHAVYHHGAGSRTKWSALDSSKVFTESSLADPSLGSLSADLRKEPRSLLRIRPRHAPTLWAASARSIRQIRKRRMLATIGRRSDQVFSALLTDPDFYLRFDEAASGASPNSSAPF